MDPQASPPSQSPKSSRPGLVVVAVLLLIIIVGIGLAYWVWQSQQPQPINQEDIPLADFEVETIEELRDVTNGKPVPPPTTDKTLPAISANEHMWGSADAAFSIVEYGSIPERYSKMMYSEMKALIEINGDEVNWIFRQWPQHDVAIDYPAAEASECVAEELGNDGFWAYLDALYNEKIISERTLESAASTLGANNLATCLASKKMNGVVLSQKQYAQIYLDLFDIPSFIFRNNTTGEIRIVKGANTQEYMQQVLNAMR